jgi:hypothetical protein
LAELLRIVERGERCAETARVTAADDDGLLICDLKPGHLGPLHYDNTDKIWWSADA